MPHDLGTRPAATFATTTAEPVRRRSHGKPVATGPVAGIYREAKSIVDRLPSVARMGAFRPPMNGGRKAPIRATMVGRR